MDQQVGLAICWWGIWETRRVSGVLGSHREKYGQSEVEDRKGFEIAMGIHEHHEGKAQCRRFIRRSS